MVLRLHSNSITSIYPLLSLSIVFYPQVRDYDTADEIKERLLSEFNVHLNDRNFTYRVWDNGSGKWSKGENCAPLEADSEAGIVLLLEKRGRAKDKREYRLADKCAEDIAERFKVYIDDQSRTFSTEIWDYERTTTIPDDWEEGKEAEIIYKIKARAKEKYSRNYRQADAIRLELREEHQVEIDDKERKWSIGKPAPAWVEKGATTYEKKTENA